MAMMVGNVSFTAQSGPDMMRMPSRTEVFNEVDANSDGSFDKVELSAMGMKLSEKTGISIDMNEIMDKFDQNRDGLLDQKEAFGALDKMKEMGKGPPPPKNGQGGPSSSPAFQFDNSYFSNVSLYSIVSLSEEESILDVKA